MSTARHATGSLPAQRTHPDPSLHHPAAATECLATAADIAGCADVTVHIPAPVVDPVDAILSAPRSRWDGVAPWIGASARVADDGRTVVGPLTAARAVPAPPLPAAPSATRRAGTVTTRVAALIAAAAFVVGAASAVVIGTITGPGGPPAGLGATPPGMSAPGGGSSTSTDGSGTTSST